MSAPVIYVAGFVTRHGIGGYNWYWDLRSMRQHRDAWAEDGYEVSPVREVSLDSLAAQSGVDLSLTDGDAITDALDRCPELWEPKAGAS